MYIGWWVPYALAQSGQVITFPLYLNEFMKYTATITANYFYSLDATLMFMSKGGISAEWCNRHGPRTKDKYLTQLQQLWKNAYGGEKKSGEMTLDDSGAAPPDYDPG